MDPGAYLAGVLVVAALSQWLAWRLRVPSILVLLVVGFFGGLLATPDEVFGREILFAGVSIAVGIILFEGSLSLRLRDVRDLGRPVIRLCSVTVMVAWGLITLAAWLVGIDPRLALLIGAILVVTGPTVINPILQQLRPTRRISSMLRWEGIVVDPVGAVLALLVHQVVVIGSRAEAFGAAALTLVTTVGVAVGIAGVLGLMLDQVVRRHWVPDYLQGVVFLSAAVGALIGSNQLQDESGLLTVTLLGIVLGNRPGLHLEQVQEFKENLQVLLVGVLFVILAGRVTPEQVGAVLPQALAFVAMLVLVVRPVSIVAGLWGTDTTRQEKLLMAGMAPRGIVAAAVTSIFALELEHAARVTDGSARGERLAALAQEAESLVPFVFVTIVCTVALYGLGVGRLAERLGLATANPQGVVFAGSQQWVREAASVLAELKVPTLIVSRDGPQLSKARMGGVRTERTNILSEYAVEELDLSGIGSFVAATADDSTNSTAAREFAHTLGRVNTFQLKRQDAREAERPDGEVATRTAAADRITARTPFQPALTHEEMDRLVAEGMLVRRRKLTEEFTLDDFRALNPDAVLLFTHDGTRTTVVGEKATVPQKGVTLVALAPPRTDPAPTEDEAEADPVTRDD